MRTGANTERRGFLRLALGGLGGLATFFGAVPFLKSFLPSARARALGDPVVVDIGKIAPGEVRAYLYRGAPILVLHRTKRMLAELTSTEAEALDNESEDPAYVDRQTRSINPDYLVVRGICTHLGCVPQMQDEQHGKAIVGDWWPGGFICPCHLSGYDYAGRVIRGPAPRNLPVPPYHFVGPTRLVIGEAAKPT
jgi:ubiquinol-cytochrome c reductase iron-sulfur subunit